MIHNYSVVICDPMDYSTWGIPVLYYLLKFGQTHVHWVNDAVQPPHHPLSPPSPALGLSAASGSFPMSQLFSSHGQKIGASASVPSNEYSGLISFRIDWFDLAVQGTLKSFLQDHSSKASILWGSAFFMVQLTSTQLLEKPQLWLDGPWSAKWCLCLLICCLVLS